MKHETSFSPDRKYRYTLWREFGTEFLFDGGNQMKEGFVQFIGLNPSTADETKDDPTIRRCIGFTKSLGYSALCMTNLFAWRATDPSELTKQPDPIGPDNDQWLKAVTSEASLIIACWGTRGSLHHRDDHVFTLLDTKVECLRLTTDGYPQHPLYLSKTLKPIPFP
jgi:hypothetical protein